MSQVVVVAIATQYEQEHICAPGMSRSDRMPFVHGLIEFHTLVHKLLYVCILGHLMYFLSVQCAPYTCTVHEHL